MLFRRQRTTDLESAYQALAQGDYDVALAMMENVAKRANRQSQGPSWLQLAALYGLYGEDGIENGQPALRRAVTADPTLASHPLYRALFWEFAAYKGGSIGDVKRGLKDVPESGEDVASYHAAAALFAVDAPKSAARRLEAIDVDALPAYLRWRRWSLLGQCWEAMGEWQDGLRQDYGGDPNLSSAYGRELGAMEAMLSGSIASRLIDDGKAADADNAAAREGLGILLNAIESKGSSLTGAAKSAVKELITDALIPKSNEEAQARADYVDEVVAHRRDAFRDAANYLLVEPSNLEAYTLGQNPPVTVDISPAATIQAYEQRLMAEYAEMGNWGFTVDADFTVPDGNGGLQIMPLEDMSAAQRGAYVEWISTPEVQQVLLQQVNSQNQAHDDVPFGMGD